jgi:hypothetical protein
MIRRYSAPRHSMAGWTSLAGLSIGREVERLDDHALSPTPGQFQLPCNAGSDGLGVGHVDHAIRRGKEQSLVLLADPGKRVHVPEPDAARRQIEHDSAALGWHGSDHPCATALPCACQSGPSCADGARRKTGRATPGWLRTRGLAHIGSSPPAEARIGRESAESGDAFAPRQTPRHTPREHSGPMPSASGSLARAAS